MNVDTVRGPPLTCDQQSAGVYSEDNARHNMNKRYKRTHIKNPHIPSNTFSQEKTPTAELGIEPKTSSIGNKVTTENIT